MKVKILGAAMEVGRSGFLVSDNNTNFLLDYGVLLRKKGKAPAYPLHVKPKDIDAVILSHAHLDHSGNIPSLFISGHNKVYATPPTLELSKLLLEDMLKLEKNFCLFGNNEIDVMMKNSKMMNYGNKIKINDSIVELKCSGHVIGGSTIIIESGKKRLFYTGDINPNGSRLLSEADLELDEIDILITESTYSQTEQMSRAESESGLIKFANEIMEQNGVLFIPAFSVERSQEIACVFQKNNFKYPIFMDGMALKVNKIISKYPEYLRDPKIFMNTLNKITQIRNNKDRENAIHNPCVIISPAGMLVGGNAIYYLNKLAFNKKNGIALVSYQGEGTQGKRLLDTGKISIRRNDVNVQARVRQFEFSGHGDRNSLFDVIKKIKGNPTVLAIHGDIKSCTMFSQEIKEKFGFRSYAPKIGETFTC